MDDSFSIGQMSIFGFNLPDELQAKEPPEKRGITRDKVRLMVIDRKSKNIIHSRFDKLRDFLNDGDLLVFNSSRTLPASLKGCGTLNGPCIEVRLALHLPDDSWLALLLCSRDDPFSCGLREGMVIEFDHELNARVETTDNRIPRLWKLRFSKTGTELLDIIYKIGQPIRYSYVSAPWDLDYYQTVYAKEPGSAEMPSAGRAFTWKLLFDLRQRGVEMAYITLHTGLSTYYDTQLDAKQVASEEEYFISESAAEKINQTKEKGGRVIAIGTTVVRALESSVDSLNRVTPGHRYTQLHINNYYMLGIVDGLITGLHEPEASHLNLLSSFLPAETILKGYKEAINLGYLWHEFGDLNLIV